MNRYTQIIDELRHLDDIPYYAPNGGNLGDALIAYNEFLFMRESGILWHLLSSLKYDKPYILIHGGGGGFVPYWRYAKQLPEYLTSPLLRRCIVMPSSFYECDFFKQIVDDRFTIFCRERRSYDYCMSWKSTARIMLCDDMAFSHDASYLIPNRHIEIARKNNIFRDAFIKSDAYLELNRSDTARFVREDAEGTDVPESDTPNFDISKIFYFKPTYGFDIAQQSVSLMSSVIDRYRNIVTNRLHVAVISHLLGKNIELYDNSYRKISGVYEMSMFGKNGNITTHF